MFTRLNSIVAQQVSSDGAEQVSKSAQLCHRHQVLRVNSLRRSSGASGGPRQSDHSPRSPCIPRHHSRGAPELRLEQEEQASHSSERGGLHSKVQPRQLLDRSGNPQRRHFEAKGRGPGTLHQDRQKDVRAQQSPFAVRHRVCAAECFNIQVGTLTSVFFFIFPQGCRVLCFKSPFAIQSVMNLRVEEEENSDAEKRLRGKVFNSRRH